MTNKRKNWKRTWRLFGIYFTLSSCRVKMRQSDRSRKLAENERNMKGQMYDKQHGACIMCGEQFDIHQMELHHILPWCKFPTLRGARKNHMLLCHNCHKEIHCNPYLNIRLQEESAKQMGIDLTKVYDTSSNTIFRL